MAETATTPESGAPTPTEQAPANADPKPAVAAGDEFKSEESKKSVLADLAKERDARQALEQKFEAQQKAFATALGLSEEPKTGDELAETVNALTKRLDDAEKRAVKLSIAAEKNIPAEYHDLLTETDTEKLRAQAEKVAVLVAAVSKNDPQNPAFQANPGQGQNGTADPSAADDAEYERFYPSTPNGK